MSESIKTQIYVSAASFAKFQDEIVRAQNEGHGGHAATLIAIERAGWPIAPTAIGAIEIIVSHAP